MHSFLDVVDLERYLCVRSGRSSRRLEEGEPTLTALIPETALPLFDGFEAKLLGVELPRAGKVLGGEPGRDMTSLELTMELGY